MRQRGVAGFLTELERRLDGDAARRRQVTAEIAEHLGDLVAEARAAGLGQAAAEEHAIERFGSPRALARGLRTRPRRLRGARVALAVGALGLSGSFAYAQLRAAPPVVAVSLKTTPPAHAGARAVTGVGRPRLVALDPATLGVVQRGPVVSTGRVAYVGRIPADAAFVSPDGNEMALVTDAALRFYDLRSLRLLGSARLGVRHDSGPTRPNQRAGELDAIRAGAWFGPSVVALVQHQSPPYASRVTSRKVVRIDPATRRVLSSQPVALRGVVLGSARTADHLVVLACHAGTASLLDVAAGGANTVIALGSPCAARAPYIGLAASDDVLAVVQSGQPLTLIDLSAHRVQRVPLRGAVTWAVARSPALAAVFWHDRLIVTGASFSPTRAGVKRWPSAGVTAIDPRTGATAVIAREGSWVLAMQNSLVVGGPSLGLTAFSPDGRRLWHVGGRRTIWPFAIGDTVFAPRQEQRHTIVDAFSARTGKLISSRFQPGQGTRPFSGVIQPTG